MATVTPNFNWPVPTSTDLVRDGATAIEALGDSIDGSLVDLKGGTTGQVLSKTSGTDMDFTWVTTDDANAIQNSIVDAKGDLISATANDTPARLAVGANGETLVADSSTSTGLRYQSGYNGNAIINGGFDIWQRGTSQSLNNGAYQYLADRFYASINLNCTNTLSQSTDTPSGFNYSLKWQRAAGVTTTASVFIYSALENFDSTRFAGQSFTLSFYAKKGANYSGSSTSVFLYSGTGTNQGGDPGTWTGSASTSAAFTTTTSWQRFTLTGTLASTIKQLAIHITGNTSGTAGADDSLFFTGFQLELGSVATSFKRAGGTIQGELAACQRYLPAIAATNGELFAGQAYASTTAIVPFIFPVTPRVPPTGITVNSAGNFRLRNNIASKLTVTFMNFSTASNNSCTLDIGVASGLAAGNASLLFNETGGTILFTGCEL
jgi:hypothetical protein